MKTCEKCGEGVMRVFKTFEAAGGKTQERRCTACAHTAVFVVIKYLGQESAYMLAKKIKSDEARMRKTILEGESEK